MDRITTITAAITLLFLVTTTAAAKNDLAFLAMHNDYWQVWLMDEGGLNPHPATDTPYDKSRISWYPNGDLLVSGNQGELTRLSLENDSEINVKIPFEHVNDAVVSPNGRYLAFSQKPEGSIFNKLWLLNIETGKKIKIGWTKGFQHEPNFSFDSGVLYYLSGDNGQSHDIMQYDIQSKSVKPVTTNKLYNLDVSPNKDNNLAFSSNRSGNYEIWIRNGSKLKKLTDHPALDGRPNWSADGEYIYFESNRGGSLNIWSVNIEGEPEVQQITHNREGARYPLWRIK